MPEISFIGFSSGINARSTLVRFSDGLLFFRQAFKRFQATKSILVVYSPVVVIIFRLVLHEIVLNEVSCLLLN